MARPLRKFSLAYDAAEDRLAWDAEDVTGATLRLWLTRRFCRDFVAALVPRLPKPGGAVAAEHEAAVQSFEQAAAMAGLGVAPGVALAPASPAALVKAVHITPAEQSVTLAFEFGEDGAASITLAAPALRQMLGLMHALHQSAGWPTDDWPAWLAAPTAAREDAPLN